MAPNLRKSTVQMTRWVEIARARQDTCVTRPSPESQDQVANHLYLKLTLELITLFRVLVFLPPSRFEIFRANSGLSLAVRTRSFTQTSWKRPGEVTIQKSLWGSGYRIQFHSMSRPDRTFLCAMVASSHLLATRSLGIFIAKDDAITWEELLQPLLQKVTTTLE